MMDKSERAKEIIEQVIYITISTASEAGQPWNTPVFSAYDDDYNFYWGSHIGSQHSRNILSNSKVFLAIYDSTAPAGEGEGVYVSAVASKITEPAEIKRAHTLLQDRRPIPYWTLDQVQSSSPVRLFKAVPEQVWMNGEGAIDGTYIDTRMEIKL
jgi:hypothetical protein